MKLTRREFSKGAAAIAGLAGAASLQVHAQSSQKASPTADAPKPAFKPVGVERSKVLKVLSGRNRPDLTPVYKMWEQLTGMKVDLTKVSHLDTMERLVLEKGDPQFDLMVTNTMAEPEIARASGDLRAVPREGRDQYADWLRAPDYSWLSITAWPRTAMINWATMGRDPAKWPTRFEDLADARFRDKVLMSSIQESIVTSYFAAMRVAKGDEYTGKLIDRAFDNGMRLYKSHAQERNALVREGYGVALVNSSNAHVFFLEGNAVGEAWLDQEEGGLGTLVESHTIAVVKGARNPGRRARLHRLHPLEGDPGDARAPLWRVAREPRGLGRGNGAHAGSIRRINATPAQVAARFKDTQKWLTDKGFNMEDLEDPYISQGKGGAVATRLRRERRPRRKAEARESRAESASRARDRHRIARLAGAGKAARSWARPSPRPSSRRRRARSGRRDRERRRRDVEVYSVPGEGGLAGLTQFVKDARGDGTQLMITGYTTIGSALVEQVSGHAGRRDPDRSPHVAHSFRRAGVLRVAHRERPAARRDAQGRSLAGSPGSPDPWAARDTPRW